MRDLQERATEDFERTLPIVQDDWRQVEREVEIERVRIEQEVADCYSEGRIDAGQRMLSDFMSHTADRMLETARALTAAL